MPITCTICAHAELPAITQALAAGVSYRAIAQHYSVSRSTLGRHQQHTACLRPQAQGREARPRAGARGDWPALQREAEHLQALLADAQAPQYTWHYLKVLAHLMVKITRTAAQQYE